MKKRNKLQSKKSIVFSTLIVASTGISAQAYVPYPDMQKNSQFDESKYREFVQKEYLGNQRKSYLRSMPVWISGMSTYGRVGPKSFSYSEKRKQSIQQVLQNIASIRTQIRNKAMKEFPNRFQYEQDKLMTNYQQSGKLIDNVLYDKGIRKLHDDKEFA